MTSLELKSNFHKLIDEITNDEVLHQFYEILSSAKDRVDGMLWHKLTSDEKQEILLSEKESHDADHLISNADMIKKNQKWL
jgi:hypothetical protein